MIKILNEYLGLNNIINDSRDTSKNGFELSEIHKKMGELLGMEIISSFPESSKIIQHAQGNDVDVKYNVNDSTAILTLMRAGLFISLGIYQYFQKSPFILIKNEKDTDEYENILQNMKNIIFIDSVVNTGNSIIKLYDYLKLENKNLRVIAATQVIQKNALDLLSNKNIDIFAIRVSDNKYKGTKSSDTGNRLFNTEFLI